MSDYQLNELKVGEVYTLKINQFTGLVRVLKIKSSTHITIEHIEDHPYGYLKGSIYFTTLDEFVKEKRA